MCVYPSGCVSIVCISRLKQRKFENLNVCYDVQTVGVCVCEGVNHI